MLPFIARTSRRLFAAVLTIACAGVLCASPATAKSGATCGGTSILPELAKSQPEAFKKIRAAADRISNTEAILWRLEKPGIQPSHLFATMHVSDKRIVDMPANATTALKAARIVALEIADLSPGAMMTAVAKVPQLMVYSDGSRLDEKLPAAEFAKARALMSEAGMPGEMAAVVRPWLISTMLSIPPCEQQRNPIGQLALDPRIGAIAKAANIPLVGLETIEQQLEAMAAVPDADQIAMLRIAIAFAKKREDMFETLIQAYLQRDVGIVLALSDGIGKIYGFKASGFAAFSRELIEKRNRRMFETSLPLVGKGQAFIAVGAAHLIGDTGLVALYRKAGFTVTAVN